LRANAIGAPTIDDFFGSRCAEKLGSEGKLADVLIANNVLAHVDDINDFAAGFARLLKPPGQSESFAREGIDLDVSTMADWVGACRRPWPRSSR
jgi:hypothetical protein